jgi:hypothetical protein
MIWCAVGSRGRASPLERIVHHVTLLESVWGEVTAAAAHLGAQDSG